jgi:hypothetical protein
MECAHNYNKQKPLFKGRYKQHLASILMCKSTLLAFEEKIHWFTENASFPNYYVCSYNKFYIHRWWKQTGLHDRNEDC